MLNSLQNRITGSDNHKILPILCVCYTNHALDQFLEGLLKNKVDKIVRVGGRSKSESLKCFNLHELCRSNQSRSQSQLLSSSRKRVSDIRDQIDACCRILYRSDILLEDVQEFLEMELPDLLHSILTAGADDDGFQQADGKKQQDPLCEWASGRCKYCECRVHFPLNKKAARALSRANYRIANEQNRFEALALEDGLETWKQQTRLLLAEHPTGIHKGQFKHMLQERVGSVLDYKQFGCKNLSQFLKLISDALTVDGDVLFARASPVEEHSQEDWITLRESNGIPAGKRVSVTSTQAENLTVQYDGVLLNIPRVDAAPLHTTDRPLDELLPLLHDAWLLSPSERCRVRDYIRGEMREMQLHSLQMRMAAFADARQAYQNVTDQVSLEVMRRASVVGMTTSGAAKQQHILRNLGVRVVIVEEAAGE